jgi:hypothetical protein
LQIIEKIDEMGEIGDLENVKNRFINMRKCRWNFAVCYSNLDVFWIFWEIVLRKKKGEDGSNLR